MSTRLSAFFFISLLFCHSALAEVNLEISHTSANLNDYITLTFTYTGNGNAQPNFDPLNKDFTLSRSTQSNQISVYNGVVKRQNKWRLLVIAKHSGRLTMPPISFENEKTQPQNILIKKNLAADPTSNDASIFMTASTQNKTPYVQQQIVYTTKLFYRVTPLSSEFPTPTVEHAILISMGDGKYYTSQINGIPYKVFEQDFAVFAENPGTLIIKPPVFKGAIQRGNIDDISQIMNDPHQVVRITAPETKLTVQPIPSEFKGKTWLPATNLILTENWPNKNETLKTGEPFIREITLQTEGLMASQLPELSFNNITGAKVYTEPSKTQDAISGSTIIGNKTFSVTYIPTGEKNITLPAISLSWWNVTTKKMETAILKKAFFNVNNVSIPVTNHPLPKTIIKKSTPLIEKKTTFTKKKAQRNIVNALPWCLVMLLSLILSFHYLKSNKKHQKTKHNKDNPVISPKQLKKTFKHACMDNNAQKANHLLVTLSHHLFPSKTIRTLLDLQKTSNSDVFTHELKTLQKALYSTNHQWQGLALWQAFLELEKDEVKAQKKPKKDMTLPIFN